MLHIINNDERTVIPTVCLLEEFLKTMSPNRLITVENT